MEPVRVIYSARTSHSDNATERLRATERGLAVIYQVRSAINNSIVCVCAVEDMCGSCAGWKQPVHPL